MKWNEMTTVQKIIYVIGLICGISYLVLSFFDLFDLLPIPKGALCLIVSVFWLNLGIIQRVKKHAIWCYILAAGYVVFALLYIFF